MNQNQISKRDMKEGIQLDKKSIRIFATDPKKWKWRDLASDCAGFANARGGHIFFGIEDDADSPPAHQRIDPHMPDRLVKGLAQHTSNVHVRAEIITHSNGGQFIDLEIVPSRKSIPSTSDARYYLATLWHKLRQITQLPLARDSPIARKILCNQLILCALRIEQCPPNSPSKEMMKDEL